MLEREIPACELVISTRVIKHETRRGGYLLSMICSCRFCGGSKLEREQQRRRHLNAAQSAESAAAPGSLVHARDEATLRQTAVSLVMNYAFPFTTFSLIVVSW